MKYITILSLFYSGIALGSDWTNESWSTQNTKIIFKYSKNLSLRINESCFKNYNRCEALRATRYLKASTIKLRNGMSPYSQICSDSTKGKVIFLLNDKGHSSSFCLFQDQSMIDTASLYFKAKK